MDESERNLRWRKIRTLLLAAMDMDEAVHAATTLLADHDFRQTRLLETAMAVCYMRPFTSPGLRGLRDFVPPAGTDDRALHDVLRVLRNKLYAHTDEETNRSVFFSHGTHDHVVDPEEWIPYGERHSGFPADLLDDVIRLAKRVRERALTEARRAWIELGRPTGEF